MTAYRTHDTPFTYIIDYYEHVVNAEEIARKLAVAPPTLFHGGHDHAYNFGQGPHAAMGRGGQAETPDELDLTLKETRKRTAQVREWTRQAHESGVRYVIAYVCNQSMFGNPFERKGFWRFWDTWEEYAEDIGPRPEADPMDWMQREPGGRPHHNYPLRFSDTEPKYRYAPCPNNPYWRYWLGLCVELMASDGYDGVFIDNNIIHCHCEHCQREFRTYLSETYTEEQLKKRFGTDNIDELKLSTLGDKILWATTQREYMQRLHDEEPELFRRLLNTDNVDDAIASDAGNGLHWWKSHCFWLDTLAETHTSDEVDMILRTGDVQSLGVETPEQLCLWADTQKFWAWSIGQRNAELRAAGRKHCPHFMTVPNFGALTSSAAVNSRRLEGKNPRLWQPGTDVMMYEEDLFPGRLAPGAVLDHIVSYKYACACGVRACVLPSRDPEHRALVELGIAEAATWSGDGMFVQVNQPEYLFPEIRKAYREFFDSRRELYQDKQSTANVGVVFSFDELHMENMHHLDEVYTISRYLTDNHILFDYLCEGQITCEELTHFDVVVIPHVQYLPADARTAIEEYVSNGGRAVITGNTGAFDEHGRECSETDVLADLRQKTWPQGSDTRSEHQNNGRIVWLNDVSHWLPDKAWQTHELAGKRFEELQDTVVPELLKNADKPIPENPAFLNLLNELAGYSLSVLPDTVPDTLRCAAWRGSDSLILHFINYDVPGPTLPKESRAVHVQTIPVSIPVDSEPDSVSVSLQDPWHPEPKTVDCAVKNGRLEFIIPGIEIYTVARLEFA